MRNLDLADRRSSVMPREPGGWELDEIVRRRRLREHARRPLSVNLAEGIALSELLAGFRGAARR